MHLRIPLPVSILPMLLCWALLTGCDKTGERGSFNRASDSTPQAPLAFHPDEYGYALLPGYVKSWRMPPGFSASKGEAAFPARWNLKVKQWLEQALSNEEQTLAEWNKKFAEATDSATRARLAERIASSQKRRVMLSERICGDDYLRLLAPSDLPLGLPWETNWDEPEIGDPRACKGGTMRLAFARSYPNTFRAFGPDSSNGFRGYLHDDVRMDFVMIHPGTGRFIPGLADRWAIADNGRCVYFHIDGAATYSDGEPVTTRDVVAALYLRTSEEAASSYFLNYYLEGISGITIYDDRTFSVHFPAPKPLILSEACIPCDPAHFYSEFGPDFAQKYRWRIPPVTGGYVADPEGIELGHRVRMKRVRQWWARNRRYTRYSCNVDFINYSFYAEASKIRELFRIGELDAVSVREPEYWHEGLEVGEVHRGYIRRIQFHNLWPRSPFGFYLNTSQAPFNQPEMRFGFHHALNIERVIETVFRGDYIRLNSYASGYGDFTNVAVQARKYSPQLARAYFATAGYTETDREGYLCTPSGKRLTVTVSCMIDPLYANFMNLLREDAARCGLDLRVEHLDNTVFYLKTMDKKVQAAVWSWAFSPPLPRLRQGFHSSDAYDENGKIVTGTNNITAVSDALMDRLLDRETFATTLDEARTASHAIQQRITDLGVWVPGWTTPFWRIACWRWVCWPDCSDTRFCPPRYHDPMDSHLYWIDSTEKERTLRAKAQGQSFDEEEWVIPLPQEAKSFAEPN